MKQLLAIASLITIFILGSCNSLQVTYDYDKDVDFSKFTTYSFHGWAKDSEKLLTPFDKERFESAFKAQFDSRNLKYMAEGGELVVALYIVTQQKTEQVANTTNMGGYYGGYGGGYGGYYGYGPGWGWGGSMGNSMTTISEVNYTVGTMVVDVFDAANKKLIWEGVGSKTIDENPSNREKNVQIIASRIMDRYPVAPVKTKK